MMTGLAGAATGAPLEMDEHILVGKLSEIGRRIMGLRQPPRPRDSSARRLPEAASGRWKAFLPES